MRLLLLGHYGYGSFSNEAILSITLRWLRELRPELQVEVASADPAGTGAVHGAEAVIATDQAALTDAVRRADGVIIGGGRLIHDHHRYNAVDLISNPLNGIPYYLSVAVMAVALNKPILHFAQSIGPLDDYESAIMSRFFFSLAEEISLRDGDSAEYLRRLNVQSPRVLTAPDIVWTENEVKLRNSNKGSQDSEDLRQQGTLGVALHSCYHPPLLKHKVSSALAIFCRKLPKYSVLVLRLDENLHHDEVEINDELSVTLPQVSMDSPYRYDQDPFQVRSLLASCDLLLSTHFHAVMTAVQNAVPCIPLICDPEMESLCRDAGLSDLALHMEDLTAESLAKKMEDAIEKPDAYWIMRQKESRQFGREALEHRQLLKGFLEKLSRPEQLTGFTRHSPPKPQFDRTEFELTLEDARHEVQRLQSKEAELQLIYKSRTWRWAASMRDVKKRYERYLKKVRRSFQEYLTK